jgi:DNA replication protein DnaC
MNQESHRDRFLRRTREVFGLKDDLEIGKMLRFAGWDLARLHQESMKPGSRERFQSEVEKGKERAVSARVAEIMRSALLNGPEFLAVLSQEELDARIHRDELKRVARTCEPDRDGGTLMCGPTGLGKTTVAASIVRRWYALPIARLSVCDREAYEKTRFPSLEWARAFDLNNARLEHKFGTSEPEVITDAKRCDFLVLDDIGRESRRPGSEDVIEEVLQERYDKGRVSFVTTGLRLEQVVERYGDAVVRRIVEAGGKPGKVVDLWPNQ